MAGGAIHHVGKVEVVSTGLAGAVFGIIQGADEKSLSLPENINYIES